MTQADFISHYVILLINDCSKQVDLTMFNVIKRNFIYEA